MRKYRKPYRAKKKKSVLRSRFFWRGILGLVFAGVFLYFFFLSPIFQTKEINISGNPVFAEEIQKLMAGKNIFLVNFEEIKKEISEKFPQIAKVNLKRKFPNRIIGEVEERKPVAVFNQEEEFFLIDKEGIIYEKTTPDSQLLKIQKMDEAGPRPELKLGSKVLEKNLISSILEIGSRLKEDLKIPFSEVLAVSNERLNIKTNEGWEIYFDPQKDINWQITKLKAVLEEEIPSENRRKLEYIDLRFGNLAPYKYR